MTMKKITAFALAMLLVFSFAACGNNNKLDEPVTEAPTQAPTEPVELVKSLSLSIQTAEGQKFLNISDYGDGSVAVEMRGDIIKKANMDPSIMFEVSIALEKSGLKALNGENLTGEDPDIICSMFIECGEEFLMADYTGVIPENFSVGYAVMEDCIAQLMADVPEYIPAPAESGIIADSDKAALDAILSGITLDAPDSFAISGIGPEDEAFTYSTGLSGAEGIASAVRFGPMMNTSPYSLVIVTLAEGADTSAIAKDFEDNIDWLRWVCVEPECAAVAIKDNQVLCVLGSGDLFSQTITSIQAAGWLPCATLENPNMAG